MSQNTSQILASRRILKRYKCRRSIAHVLPRDFEETFPIQKYMIAPKTRIPCPVCNHNLHCMTFAARTSHVDKCLTSVIGRESKYLTCKFCHSSVASSQILIHLKRCGLRHGIHSARIVQFVRSLGERIKDASTPKLRRQRPARRNKTEPKKCRKLSDNRQILTTNVAADRLNQLVLSTNNAIRPTKLVLSAASVTSLWSKACQVEQKDLEQIRGQLIYSGIPGDADEVLNQSYDGTPLDNSQTLTNELVDILAGEYDQQEDCDNGSMHCGCDSSYISARIATHLVDIQQNAISEHENGYYQDDSSSADLFCTINDQLDEADSCSSAESVETSSLADLDKPDCGQTCLLNPDNAEHDSCSVIVRDGIFDVSMHLHHFDPAIDCRYYAANDVKTDSGIQETVRPLLSISTIPMDEQSPEGLTEEPFEIVNVHGPNMNNKNDSRSYCDEPVEVSCGSTAPVIEIDLMGVNGDFTAGVSRDGNEAFVGNTQNKDDADVSDIIELSNNTWDGFDTGGDCSTMMIDCDLARTEQRTDGLSKPLDVQPAHRVVSAANHEPTPQVDHELDDRESVQSFRANSQSSICSHNRYSSVTEARSTNLVDVNDDANDHGEVSVIIIDETNPSNAGIIDNDASLVETHDTSSYQLKGKYGYRTENSNENRRFDGLKSHGQNTGEYDDPILLKRNVVSLTDPSIRSNCRDRSSEGIRCRVSDNSGELSKPYRKVDYRTPAVIRSLPDKEVVDDGFVFHAYTERPLDDETIQNDEALSCENVQESTICLSDTSSVDTNDFSDPDQRSPSKKTSTFSKDLNNNFLERCATVASSPISAKSTAIFRCDSTPVKFVYKEPCTPKPNYSQMDTPRLKKEMSRFGLKAFPKKRMIKKLDEIYEQTHQYETDNSFVDLGGDEQQRNGKNAETSMLESSIYNIDPEQSGEVDGMDDDSSMDLCILKQIRKVLISDGNLHRRILFYDPISLQEIINLLKSNEVTLGKQKLMKALDMMCITFTLDHGEHDQRRIAGRKRRRRK